MDMLDKYIGIFRRKKMETNRFLVLAVYVMIAYPLICMGSGPGQQSSPTAYSTDLETRLRSEMFNNYDRLQRPDRKIDITVSLTLLAINDLNIKQQAMVFSGYLDVVWYDQRLNWSNKTLTTQDYTSIGFLFTEEGYIWIPSLVVENSVRDISVISGKDLPIRISSSGKVYWNPSGLFKISCESHPTYYPLDTQICEVTLSSWVYTAVEVQLENGLINLDKYIENGEWVLVSTESLGEESSQFGGGNAFSTVRFILILKRRPMYLMMNTIVPVFIMAVLMSFVFKVPAETGERLGFSLTVLLAYAVYLMMISDFIPSTSVSVCYLSVYLLFTLILASGSVILSIVVLHLHFKSPDDKIPDCLVKMTKINKQPRFCIDSCRVNKIYSHHDEIQEQDEKYNSKEKYTKQQPEECTWSDVSRMIDKILFLIYIALVVLATITYLAVLIKDYLQ